MVKKAENPELVKRAEVALRRALDPTQPRREHAVERGLEAAKARLKHPHRPKVFARNASTAESFAVQGLVEMRACVLEVIQGPEGLGLVRAMRARGSEFDRDVLKKTFEKFVLASLRTLPHVVELMARADATLAEVAEFLHARHPEDFKSYTRESFETFLRGTLNEASFESATKHFLKHWSGRQSETASNDNNTE